MDTIARGGPETVPGLLQELGYDGLGGRALDESMPAALHAQGLRFFNGYHVLSLDARSPTPDREKLDAWFKSMRSYQTALWLAIKTVTTADGAAAPASSPAVDDLVAQRISELATAAADNGVNLALYPHTGFWLERFEDATRIATKLDRRNVGVTFNLCHWLRVEGAERDPLPLLREHLPRLMFVTVNGADTGDTRHFPWSRLIQPLDSGSYDWRPLVRQLRAVGYSGPFGFQGYGIQGNHRMILQRSIAAWRAMLADSPH